MIGSRWSGKSRVLELLYEWEGLGVGGEIEHASL
jgi:hypothetical protein